MKRIFVILEVENENKSLEKTVPGRLWPGSTAFVALLVCISLSLGLTIQVNADNVSDEKPLVCQTVNPQSPGKTGITKTPGAVEQFMAQRAKKRAEMEQFTAEELKAAEQSLEIIRAGYNAGMPECGLDAVFKAQKKTAVIKLARTREQKYADEYILCCKKIYDMVLAQYKVGHKDGSAGNLARAALDYYEAKLAYAALEERPNPDDIRSILKQAENMNQAVKGLFDTGNATTMEVKEVNALSLKLKSTYTPILEELISESVPEGNKEK